MNNDTDLISIIVPVYKVEKYLSRCIESIFAQTYTSYEVILIDDDSPDNCPRICDEFATMHNNVFVIHLKDSGVGASGARNAGIEIARGKYITFIDSDDYVDKDLLVSLMKGIGSSPDVLLSMCSYNLAFDSKADEINNVASIDLRIVSDLDGMDMLISDQTRSAVWGKLYSRDLFKDLQFPVGKHNEDMFVMPAIFKKAKKIAVTSQRLYYYYQDSESLCRSSFNYNMLNMLEALFVWKEHVRIYYPSLQRKCDSHYYSTIIDMCQYLAIKTDDYGLEKYGYFKNIIKSNSYFILISPYVTFNNKIKTILFNLLVFKLIMRIFILLKIRGYI